MRIYTLLTIISFNIKSDINFIKSLGSNLVEFVIPFGLWALYITFLMLFTFILFYWEYFDRARQFFVWLKLFFRLLSISFIWWFRVISKRKSHNFNRETSCQPLFKDPSWQPWQWVPWSFPFLNLFFQLFFHLRISLQST